jgi:hypothetical protein
MTVTIVQESAPVVTVVQGKNSGTGSAWASGPDRSDWRNWSRWSNRRNWTGWG